MGKIMNIVFSLHARIYMHNVNVHKHVYGDYMVAVSSLYVF